MKHTAALTDVNIRTQLNNLDLHRVIRAKNSTAEEVIEAAWDVNESIRCIAEELSPETKSTKGDLAKLQHPEELGLHPEQFEG